jgi:hypothetical protein
VFSLQFGCETSTSEGSTSFMKQDFKGIISHGDGLCLEPNASLLVCIPFTIK